MNTKGITLFRSPIPKNANHTSSFLGGRNPIINAILQSVMAAKPTLRVTMVRGGNSETATPTKKNYPPQRTDNAMSMIHSRAPMEVLMDYAIANTTLTFDYFRLNLS